MYNPNVPSGLKWTRLVLYFTVPPNTSQKQVGNRFVLKQGYPSELEKLMNGLVLLKGTFSDVFMRVYKTFISPYFVLRKEKGAIT